MVKMALLKATWLTNVDSQILHSRSNLAAGLARLAELGFNTIYPVVWQRGYTLYPSEVARELTGAAVLANSPFVDRDILAEIIELARPLNIRVIPWFEYGLMVPPQSVIARQQPKLIMLDRQGNSQRINGANGQRDPNAWLNPSHDRVRKFMVDLIADLVQRYPVAGIQLDDHFAWPIELGYDPLTQKLFNQQRQLGWDQWRGSQLTGLLQQIVGAVKAIWPEGIVSISPNPLSFSQSRYLLDWQQWANLGLIDELVLQVYRDQLTAFERELAKPEVRSIKPKIPTLIGILTGLRTKPIASTLIKQQVEMITAQQFGGVACFFYETLLHEQLSPVVITRTNADLIDIFNV
jgi:uncharacterized lipoprotein YddW (UPF0748 family)